MVPPRTEDEQPREAGMTASGYQIATTAMTHLARIPAETAHIGPASPMMISWSVRILNFMPFRVAESRRPPAMRESKSASSMTAR
jgi:hypothetical protein